MRLARFVLLGGLLTTLGCERHQRDPKPPVEPSPTASPSKPPPEPEPLQVSAVVASVSLADDCAIHSALPVPPSGFTLVSTADVDDSRGGAAQAPTGGTSITRRRESPTRSQTRRACQQTSMQVMLTAGSVGARSTIEIARVELLDADGQAPLGDLTARNPRHWTGSQYDVWDGAIAPGAMLKTTWDLSAPDWSRLGGSRDAAAGRTFVVRVTLRVAGQDATSVATGKVTLPKKVKVKSPPIMVEPPVMT